MTILDQLQNASADDQGYAIKCALREAKAQGWIDEDAFKSAMHWVAVGAFVDAALTLVPAKSLWSVADMEDGPVAEVLIPLLGGHFGEGGSSRGATPALALCIAALKAQQSKAEVA